MAFCRFILWNVLEWVSGLRGNMDKNYNYVFVFTTVLVQPDGLYIWFIGLCTVVKQNCSYLRTEINTVIFLLSFVAKILRFPKNWNDCWISAIAEITVTSKMCSYRSFIRGDLISRFLGNFIKTNTQQNLRIKFKADNNGEKNINNVNLVRHKNLHTLLEVQK